MGFIFLSQKGKCRHQRANCRPIHHEATAVCRFFADKKATKIFSSLLMIDGLPEEAFGIMQDFYVILSLHQWLR